MNEIGGNEIGGSGFGGPEPTLIERVKAIILKPKDEWPKIAGESTSSGDLLTRYVMPLAAIGPVASFLGGQVFGYGALGISVKPGLMGGLGTLVTSYVLALVGIIALAFIADFLAPKFGGEANRTKAFRLVAYGATASMVAGVFGLVPALSIFGLLGLYSLYLLFTGAAPLMKVPQDKVLPFTVVTVLAGIALNLVVGALSVSAMGLFGGVAALTGAAADDSATVTLPNGNKVDTAKIEEIGKRMEDAANGKARPVDPAKLQALLPEAIGGYKRTALETVGAGIGATAEGTYEDASGHRFRLKIVDMAALGALAGLGTALGVEQSREDADGYERTGTVDGRMQSESWRKGDSSGKFGTVIAERFMVEAEGSTASIDALKNAVAEIDEGDLEDLVG